jgi:hypothetical protein
MDRENVMEQISSARSPHDTSSAIVDARAWLIDHPEDQRVVSAMEALIHVERQSFGLRA